MGLCRRCRPVSHRVPHSIDMGGHPLKVDTVSQGSELEEVVNGEGEAMVGAWTVTFN